MRIHQSEYSRSELLRRVGNLAQVGGIELVTYEQGHARGARGLEVRTGTGFRFTINPDRGMDIGQAEFQGIGLCWIPPKGFAGPWYYEGDLDDYAWLRVGLGGLFNTAGLVSIGVPRDIDTSQYGFTQRMTDRYGTHGRIALTPATSFNFGERWEGDRCLLWVEGSVRQDIAYGENLLLTRSYSTEIGASWVRMVDIVRNDGWFDTPHQLLYHINIGFPVVDEGSVVLAAVEQEPEDMSFTTSEEAKTTSSWRTVTAPVTGFTHEGYVVSMKPGDDGKVAVAVVNRRLRPEIGGIGVYLRYDQRQLPTYIAWRMMREGLYAVGMEPATNPFASVPELTEQGYAVMLKPGESRTYETELGVLVGREAIEEFESSLPA